MSTRILGTSGRARTLQPPVLFPIPTQRPVFHHTLRRCLTIQLEQSPFLRLISDQRIQHTLSLMGHSANTRLTPDVASAICERTNSAAVLEGSIAPIGSQYVLQLQAKNCRTGEILDMEQVQAAKKEDVLNALDQIASHFRKSVGESLTTIQQRDTPLAEATTASLDALEASSTGWKLHTTTGAIAALPFMQRAVEIDPNFSLAHATLDVNTPTSMNLIAPVKAPPGPGSCANTQATVSVSSLTPITRFSPQGTWSRHGKLAKRGRDPILAIPPLTSCCRAFPIRRWRASIRPSSRRERLPNSYPDCAMA